VLGALPNENAGRSGGRAPSWIADTGLRPEPREYDAGAEVEGAAGKVNAGNGRGIWLWAPPGGMGWAVEVILANDRSRPTKRLLIDRNHRISKSCSCWAARGSEVVDCAIGGKEPSARVLVSKVNCHQHGNKASTRPGPASRRLNFPSKEEVVGASRQCFTHIDRNPVRTA
jgi:hypothetical protein